MLCCLLDHGDEAQPSAVRWRCSALVRAKAKCSNSSWALAGVEGASRPLAWLCIAWPWSSPFQTIRFAVVCLGVVNTVLIPMASDCFTV